MNAENPTRIPTHTAETLINRLLTVLHDNEAGVGTPLDVHRRLEAAVDQHQLSDIEKIEIQGSPRSLRDQVERETRLRAEAALAFAPANATDAERNTIATMMVEANADLRRTAMAALEMLDHISCGRLVFEADALGRLNAALNNLTAVHTLRKALRDREQ